MHLNKYRKCAALERSWSEMVLNLPRSKDDNLTTLKYEILKHKTA